VGHVEKEFTAKEPKLIKYLATVRRMEKHFMGFTLRHILRSENTKADELFYQGLTTKSNTRRRGAASCSARYRKQRLEINHFHLPKRDIRTTKQAQNRQNEVQDEAILHRSRGIIQERDSSTNAKVHQQ
jgi:hypothetical protein